MRVVQLANMVTPTSGGLRTFLDRLGRGYTQAGHDVHQVVPSARPAVEMTPAGVVHHLAGVPLPGSGGYRVLLRRDHVRALLDDLAPDRLEVSDRFTLPWVGAWAQDRGIPATVVVHERLSAALATWLPLGPLAPVVAGLADRRLPCGFTHLVVPSAWAAEPFAAAPNVSVVPLGVDLETFRPGVAPPATSAATRLVVVTRLSREKRPDLAIATLQALRREGVDAELHLVGDGPMRPALQRRATGLPVTFHGFVRQRARVAELLAGADVALSTCGVETFGLAALEALACGTPVAATSGGAVPELLGGDEGVVAEPSPRAMAGAVRRLLERDVRVRRSAARTRAACHPWSRTVAGMLAVHGMDGPPVGRAVHR